MHRKLEGFMRSLGGFIYDNPFKVILIALTFLAFPISYAPQIKIDTSTEGFMYDDDPTLLAYNAFRAQFGRDEYVVLAIKSDKIFTLKFLQTLRQIHEEIERTVPFVEDVNSLYSVRNTRGEGSKLIIDPLLEPFPVTQKQVDVIKKRVMASHFYKDLFISADGKMTSIMIKTDAYSHEGKKKEGDREAFDDDIEQQTHKKFLTDKENTQLISAVLAIADKYKKEGLSIYVAGSPVVNYACKSQIKEDTQKFMHIAFIAFLVIIVLLFVMFRRVSAVLYCALVTIFSLLATVGLMAWSGIAFKLPTQVVPLLLLAVSIGATVHMLSIFFDKFNRMGNKKEALKDTLGHSGPVIAMTFIATAIGVGSFAGSQIVPISNFGIFALFGVMVSLFLTFTLLPALLSISKLKPKVNKKAKKLDIFMKNISVLPIKYYKIIIGVSAILFVIAFVAATKIELSHNALYLLQSDNNIRISTEVIDKSMNGSVSIELIVDTKKENGWTDPVRLEKLNIFSAKMEQYVDKHTHIGKVVSLATIVKEINRALHGNDEAHYSIPDNANLIFQELLLFEKSGSDDLEDVVNSQFSKARITIKLPWTDAAKAEKVLTYVREEAKKIFNTDTTVTTGKMPQLIDIFSDIASSSIQSYFIAFIIITLMMIFILGSIRLGLLSMLPNLMPIILGLLIMYITNIPLDMFTLLVGPIAMALIVSNTIHFMHNFKRYYLHTKDSSLAIEYTFYTAGKAVVIASIILSLGFYAYTMSEMISAQNFGFLAGSVIVLALLVSLLLTPSLMIIAAKRAWIK